MEGNSQLTLSSTTVRIVDAGLPPVHKRPNVLECFICLEPPIDPIFTSCGHVFCWPCMYQWLQDQPKPCPACRYTLRRNLNIIPLYGFGGPRRGEPSNGNGCHRPGEIAAASNSLNIPPRPRNPLLVIASANMDDDGDAPSIENFHSVSNAVTSTSVLIAYLRSISELAHALSVERNRAEDMVGERVTLLLQEDSLVHGIADLRRELEQRHWELFLERNQKMRNDARVKVLERRNFRFMREAEESQARERRLIERGIQMGEYIARLEKQLDRANEILPPGWSQGL